MNKAGLVVLGVSVSGLLAWLGVRRSTGLKGELAYQRWRRQRVHTVVLPHPGPTRAQYMALGRALVWDGDGRDNHRLDK